MFVPVFFCRWWPKKRWMPFNVAWIKLVYLLTSLAYFSRTPNQHSFSVSFFCRKKYAQKLFVLFSLSLLRVRIVKIMKIIGINSFRKKFIPIHHYCDCYCHQFSLFLAPLAIYLMEKMNQHRCEWEIRPRTEVKQTFSEIATRWFSFKFVLT